jgi:hypothetical protein
MKTCDDASFLVKGCGMTGYLFLGGFVLLTASHAAAFFTGYRKGKKAAGAEFNMELRRRAQNEIEFEKEKAKIMKEVFNDAEKKKAALSAGSSAERFNRANDVLRGNAAN